MSVMLYYSFPSTDTAENAAAALRRRMPAVGPVYVSEEIVPPPDPEYAFFPINSVTPNGFVGNWYPTLFAFNAVFETPPFERSLAADPGSAFANRDEKRDTARLSVCCSERDARAADAVVRAQPGAEPIPYNKV